MCQRSMWVPDQYRLKCAACDESFGYILRRHHCRKCGDVFCSRCTVYRLVLQTQDGVEQGEQRVCSLCMKAAIAVRCGSGGGRAAATIATAAAHSTSGQPEPESEPDWDGALGEWSMLQLGDEEEDDDDDDEFHDVLHPRHFSVEHAGPDHVNLAGAPADSTGLLPGPGDDQIWGYYRPVGPPPRVRGPSYLLDGVKQPSAGTLAALPIYSCWLCYPKFACFQVLKFAGVFLLSSCSHGLHRSPIICAARRRCSPPGRPTRAAQVRLLPTIYDACGINRPF